MKMTKIRLLVSFLFLIVIISGYIVYRQESEADQVADLSGQLYITHNPPAGPVVLPVPVEAKVLTTLSLEKVELRYRKKWFLFYGGWKTSSMSYNPIKPSQLEQIGVTEVNAKGEIPPSNLTRYLNYKIFAEADKYVKAKTYIYTLKVKK